MPVKYFMTLFLVSVFSVGKSDLNGFELTPAFHGQGNKG